MSTPHKLNPSQLDASILLAASHEDSGSQKSLHLEFSGGATRFKVYRGTTPDFFSTASEAVAAYNGYDETIRRPREKR